MKLQILGLLMESLWNWEIGLIVSIQTIHNPGLDQLFNAITFLGEIESYLLILPFIIWSVSKPVGFRVAYLFLFTFAVNTWAKLIIDHPRPFDWPSPDNSPVLKLNARAGGPGIPSGHAQLSLSLWYYLAYRFNQTWLWVGATILVILISFSRIYLGVHFPTDVLAGIGLGLTVLGAFIKIEPELTDFLSNQTVFLQISLAVMLPLAVILIHPHPDTVAAMGTLSGLSLGVILDQKAIHFQATGSIKRRLARFLVGLVPLLLLFEGINLLEPGPESSWQLPVSIMRYNLSGFWVSGGALWLFQQTMKSPTRNELS